MQVYFDKVFSIYTLAEWGIFFFIYCFLGWVWECCYVSVAEKQLVNRGFMKGPCLPIYGSGALCILLVTIPVRGNYALMVLVSILAATLLEYATGAVMERLFRVRYWDYTGKFLNINGYVCLESTVCWGVMSILLTEVVQPQIAQRVLQLPELWIIRIDIVLLIVAAGDFATSFKAAMDLRELLIRAEKAWIEVQEIRERMAQLQNGLKEKASDTVSAAKEKATDTVSAAKEKAADTVAAAKEKASGTVFAAKEKAAALRELELREKLSIERVQAAYSESIAGLLRRNPGTTDRHSREVFEVVKRNLLARTEHRKESAENDR